MHHVDMCASLMVFLHRIPSEYIASCRHLKYERKEEEKEIDVIRKYVSVAVTFLRCDFLEYSVAPIVPEIARLGNFSNLSNFSALIMQ